MSKTRRLRFRYEEKLRLLPVPGYGRGFHQQILGVANLARCLRLPPSRVFTDISRVADQAEGLGSRSIEAEICQAIEKAYSFEVPGTAGSSSMRRTAETKRPRPSKPKVREARVIASPEEQAARRAEIHQGTVISEELLRALSPVSLPAPDGDINEQALIVFEKVFQPSDHVFIGHDRDSYSPFTVVQLTRVFRENSRVANCLPFIIPNVLTGCIGETKSGRASYRADSCVEHAHIMCVEFDGVPIAEQRSFFACVSLPVIALIYSGSKSIHAWVDLRRAGGNPRGLTHLEWKDVVTNGYKPQLVALGADPQTFNLSRLSRLPGHFRREKGQYQRLLYLDPTPSGAPIISRINRGSHA